MNTKTIGRIAETGVFSYVKDGTLYRGAPSETIMVDSESDLSGLTGMNIGTVAHTAGFTAVWQLSADGEWVQIV